MRTIPAGGSAQALPPHSTPMARGRLTVRPGRGPGGHSPNPLSRTGARWSVPRWRTSWPRRPACARGDGPRRLLASLRLCQKARQVSVGRSTASAHGPAQTPPAVALGTAEVSPLLQITRRPASTRPGKGAGGRRHRLRTRSGDMRREWKWWWNPGYKPTRREHIAYALMVVAYMVLGVLELTSGWPTGQQDPDRGTFWLGIGIAVIVGWAWKTKSGIAR